LAAEIIGQKVGVGVEWMPLKPWPHAAPFHTINSRQLTRFRGSGSSYFFFVIKFNYLKPEMRMPNQAPSAGKFRPLNFLSGRQGASSGHCDDSLDCDLPLEGS